jgi:hypothetical protein
LHKNFVGLADRIEQLVDSLTKALKLGQAVRETALNRHNPKKIATTIVDIYKNIMID